MTKNSTIQQDENFKNLPLAKVLWNIGPVKDTRPTQEIIAELRKGWKN
ncbi:hypothetical protein J4219_02455 [Candidatus Woesearchaeota archaeon]|nr:hypothetical protein [Candidatus Woesearchaeota archaeon]